LRRVIRSVLISIALHLALTSSAQYTPVGQSPFFSKPKNIFSDTVWTVKGQTLLDKRYKRWKMDFAFDARQTLVSSTAARIIGVRVGLEHRRVHRFGIGVYALDDEQVVSTLREVDERIEDATLNISYASLFYERVMYFSKRWEWSLTGHLGRGQITGRYRIPGELVNYEYSQDISLMEGSTTLYYHIFYFMSLGTGLGYRYVTGAPDELQPVYNAPVAIARLRIRLIKMTVGIFNKDVRTAY
jgi:hypothetical protein